MAWRIRIASLHHSDVTVVRHEYIFALIAMLNVNMGAFDMSRSTMHESITDAFAAFSLLEARWRRVDRHHDGMGTKLAHGVSPLLSSTRTRTRTRMRRWTRGREEDKRTRHARTRQLAPRGAAWSLPRNAVAIVRSSASLGERRSPE